MRKAICLAVVAAMFPATAAAQCALPAAGETASVALSGAQGAVTVHAPSAYRAGGEPLPLVFLLHGSGSTGAAMLRDSALAATADAEGFIVVAPDAGIPLERGFAWNIPGVPTVAGEIPGPDDRDDVAYLGGIADALVAQGCVDPERVYATGLSGGGRMTSWLGCADSDRYAAIAPVVGLRAGRALPENHAQVDPASCRPDNPVPVIAFAGTKDRTNPLWGGQGMRWGYSMPAAERRWAALNGCEWGPLVTWIDEDTYEHRFGACEDGADVVSRMEVEGGHSWVVDNGVLWDFFASHRRSRKSG
ncbi:PHB depolymerase family esterase [Qipengyuania sp. JC766]|uniref:alpha/beta hydrolase family esterase n=1 Tax=Qipengyuania sp. JC766 TaxID=3232139 RepID=UPI003458085F